MNANLKHTKSNPLPDFNNPYFQISRLTMCTCDCRDKRILRVFEGDGKDDVSTEDFEVWAVSYLYS